MGITLILLKRYSESLEFLDSSIKVCRTIGVRSIEAYALKHLALLHLILGEGTLAFQYCDRALSIATELGIPLAKECQELKEQLFTKKHKL